MEKVKEETDVDRLNGDAAAEVKNATPTVDGTNSVKEEKAEEPSEKPSEKPSEEPSAESSTEPSAEPSAELLEKIKSQIEYYFGNVNMHRDKFLIAQAKMDNGWIPMSIMLNFKRLAALSKDVDIILKALETSDLIEISEDRKRIRRSPEHPLPEYNEEYRKAQEARTIYVKGFPQDITIDDLKVYFEQYKPYDTIVMRKYQDKDKTFKFKGSVFVQFAALDGAKAFMALESVKHGDTELIKKWSVDYSAERIQEKEERRKKRMDTKSKNSATTDQKETDEADKTPAGRDNKLPKGSVIFFSGVSKTCTREDIKVSLSEFGANIAYIDFQRGNTEGWVRLQGEDAAYSLLDKIDEGKVTISGVEVTCRVIKDEEEDQYLSKVLEEITALKNKFKTKRVGKKGRKMQGGKKRNGSPIPEAVPAKKIAK